MCNLLNNKYIIFISKGVGSVPTNKWQLFYETKLIYIFTDYVFLICKKMKKFKEWGVFPITFHFYYLYRI